MAKQSSGWVTPDNESSNIKFIKWDEGEEKGKGNLSVEFHNGGKGHYQDVPKQTFKDFRAAESAGKYLHGHIKDKYTYVKDN